MQAAAAVLQAYPPRGTLNLQLSVDKQPVTSLMSGIDRIVIQDYVIDTIHYFDGDNNELARRLGIGMHCLSLHCLTICIVQIATFGLLTAYTLVGQMHLQSRDYCTIAFCVCYCV